MALERRKEPGEAWETVEASGGGGSLPAWWTVDSTPDAEMLTINGGLLVTPPLVPGAEGREISFYAGQGDTGQAGGTITLDAGTGDAGNGGAAGSEISGGGDDGAGGGIDFTAGHGGADAAGGDVQFHAGRGNGFGGADPGHLLLFGNEGGGTGGDVALNSGKGRADTAGGTVSVSGGDGNDGASGGAVLDVHGGDDTSGAGRLGLFTDASYGTAGQVLTAQGDGTAIWVLGGSLPDWWTVDSTPGAESVTFAGEMVIAPTSDVFGALRIQIAPSGTSELTQWLDENGDPLAKITGTGRLDLTGSRPGSGLAADYLRIYDSSPNSPVVRIKNDGSIDLNPNDDTVFPLSVGSVLIVGPEDGSAPAAEVDQRPDGVGLRIIASGTTPGNLSEIWNAALTPLHTVGPAGQQGWFSKAATPAAQQTGVAVTAAGIHAALVNYGLITA